MKLIAHAAEAKLYQDKDVLIKDRIEKSYRIDEIDNKLRLSRTKREAKILDKLEKIGFPSPRLRSSKKNKISMEFINGPKVRDVLEKKDYKKISRQIGKQLAILHNNNIIHGDLTTSNILLTEDIYFVDFGLSFFSRRIEDKAVDLHLFRQALESKHHTIWKVCFKEFLNAYKKDVEDSKEILARLEEVEKRGRHKNK